MNSLTLNLLKLKIKLLSNINDDNYSEEENNILHSKHGELFVINTTSEYKGITPTFKVGVPLIIDNGNIIYYFPTVTEINWKYRYFISDNVLYNFHFVPLNIFKLINNDQKIY